MQLSSTYRITLIQRYFLTTSSKNILKKTSEPHKMVVDFSAFDKFIRIMSLSYDAVDFLYKFSLFNDVVALS